MSAVPNPTGSIVRRRLSADYLRALPKAEVHCHLEGCVPPKTAVRLAERHGVALPAGARDGGDRYRFLNFDEGLEIYLAVCRSMQTAGDFEAVTYESLVTAAEEVFDIARSPSTRRTIPD